MASLSRILLLALIAALFSTAARAEEDDDGVRYINFVSFRPEIIQLYWIDQSNHDKEIRVDAVQPYRVSRHETHAGHVFAYYVGQERHTVVIEQQPQQQESAQMELIRHENHHQEVSIPVLCSTTEGDLRITVQPSWSPFGAARFLDLVHRNYFEGCALNRVVKKFLVQFGISANYQMRTIHRSDTIPDDVVRGDVLPFQPGYMAYAGSGPNSRTTEMFIVMPDTPSHQLKAFGQNPWETPFATLHPDDVNEVVANFFSYGDMPPWGKGPNPQLIYKQDGYNYLAREFPDMSYIQECNIVSRFVDAEEEEL